MKILVIQQKMIGDVLTSSILFRAIREQFPDAELHYLIQPYTLPVVKNNPYIDQIIFDRTTAEATDVSLPVFAKYIAEARYDYILDVYSKLGTAYLCLRSSAKSIGYKKWYTQFVYNKTISYLKKPKTNAGLAIENRLRLLQILPGNFPDSFKPKIYLTAEEKNKALQFLREAEVAIEAPIFMIGLLGSAPNKTYPLKYLTHLLEVLIQEKPEAQVLLNYIPSQKEAVDQFLNVCSAELKAVVFPKVYAANLRDFIAVLSHCKALIGNEGGAVNMAKALDVPTFAIFSPWISKEAWALFEDEKNVAVHLSDFKPEYFQKKSNKQIKKETETLYQQFVPDLIKPQLATFLRNLS